jgi:hypothetical protein
MTFSVRPFRFALVAAVTALALVAGAPAPSRAQVHCFPDSVMAFPRIGVCAFPGIYQDASVSDPLYCISGSTSPFADSIQHVARAISVRFKRDRLAEARPDFGGYRIYRATNEPDSAKMILVRRYSRQPGDERTWNFSVVDSSRISPTYLEFVGRPGTPCAGQVVHDSIVTFLDPDSSGAYRKVCRNVDASGRCLTPRDSVMVLVVPPGPHDGFRTWYAVTYEEYNGVENNYEDMFVPDTSDWSACGVTANPDSCPNLNNKLANITATYVEPTAGPTANLERVGVVPNPFRAGAPWDPQSGNELHFINLPEQSTIQIFTVSGDLVATLKHSDPVRDFERWNLLNDEGQPVASGIYMYRVVSGTFHYQNRFIVIR